MNLIKKILLKTLSLVEYYLCINWFNPFATIYVNFRSMSFHKALKFPIWVFGRPKFMCLFGEIEIKGKIKSGMIRFNYINIGSPSNMGCQSELNNSGKIIFRGTAKIRTGNRIVVGRGAVLDIGNNCIIGDFINIGCFKSIKIGENTRIAHRSQIFDSNYHYVADLMNNIVSQIISPIIIGKGCWICNSCCIQKGTVLPDYCIVASYSQVGKDWSNLDEATMLAGVPAKPIAMRRYLVNKQHDESELTNNFVNSSDTVIHISSDFIKN